jgi:hypothetical protein
VERLKAKVDPLVTQVIVDFSFAAGAAAIEENAFIFSPLHSETATQYLQFFRAVFSSP